MASGVDACPPSTYAQVQRLDNYVAKNLNGASPYLIKINVEGRKMFTALGGRELFARDDLPEGGALRVLRCYLSSDASGLAEVHALLQNYGAKVWLIMDHLSRLRR